MSFGIFDVIGGIFTGVSGITSLIGGEDAADAARDQAAEEARLEGIVTDEKIRALGVEEEVTRGQTIAAQAGSGVKVGSGSPLDVLGAQAREFQYLRNVTREAGATRALAARQRGDLVATQARYGSYGTAANQFASLFNFFRP